MSAPAPCTPPGARAADTLASEALLRRFQGELRGFIARRVPGPDADDVLQETLLRLHLGVGALRDAERLLPWVYRVARSAVVDHQRRQRARPRLVEAVDSDIESESDLLPDEPSAEIRARLARCVEPFLEDLSPEQAEALRLTDLGELSQAEVARRLGLPLPTVRARVQRGRKHLRARFERCCAFAVDGRGAVIEATPRCGCQD